MSVLDWYADIKMIGRSRRDGLVIRALLKAISFLKDSSTSFFSLEVDASNLLFLCQSLFLHAGTVFPQLFLCIFMTTCPRMPQQFFLQLFPCPNPSISLLFLAYHSIHVRAFSDHMSCFCVSKNDRLCNICTPSTSYVEKGKVCGTLQGLKFSDSSEIEIKFDDRYSLPRRSGQSWKSLFLTRL